MIVGLKRLFIHQRAALFDDFIGQGIRHEKTVIRFFPFIERKPFQIGRNLCENGQVIFNVFGGVQAVFGQQHGKVRLCTGRGGKRFLIIKIGSAVFRGGQIGREQYVCVLVYGGHALRMERFEPTQSGSDFFQFFGSLTGVINRKRKAAFINSPVRGIHQRIMKIDGIGT